MLSLDTAYRSFGGEVEASSTPTICRPPDSRRHQLSALARAFPTKVWDAASSRCQRTLLGSDRASWSRIARLSRYDLSALVGSPCARCTSPILLYNTERSCCRPALSR